MGRAGWLRQGCRDLGRDGVTGNQEEAAEQGDKAGLGVSRGVGDIGQSR